MAHTPDNTGQVQTPSRPAGGGLRTIHPARQAARGGASVPVTAMRALAGRRASRVRP